MVILVEPLMSHNALTSRLKKMKLGGGGVRFPGGNYEGVRFNKHMGGGWVSNFQEKKCYICNT